MIQVFDNIIPEYIQDHIFKLITSQDPNEPYPLHYYHNLTSGEWGDDAPSEIGFGGDFFHNNSILHSGTSLLTPLYLFLTSQNLILKKIIQARTFFQIPTPCIDKPQIQYPHVDRVQNHYAMIYYVTDTDGDTYFYSDKEGKNIIKQVSPKKGRIAFFDGSIWHSGSSTTKGLRIILNFNFLI